MREKNSKKPFKFSICKKSFSQEIDFHKHTCRNGLDFSNTLFVKEYKCELCKAGFKSTDTFHFHKRSCSWVHERKNIMKDNIKVVKERRKQMKYLGQKRLDDIVFRPYNCNSCDSAFEFNKDLILHTESIHEGKKPFTCSICQKSFSQESDLPKHTCRNGSDLKCEPCGVVFISAIRLNLHKDSCSLVHKGKNSLKDDITIIHEVSNKIEEETTSSKKKTKYSVEKEKVLEPSNSSYPCIFCRRVFKRQRSMLYHINLTHEKQTLGENSHECFKCHSRFGRKYHLIMHLKETHQENEPFFCDNCDENFSSHQKMIKHVKLVHWYLCEHCDDKFPTNELRNEHTKLIHTKQLIHQSLYKKDSKINDDKSCSDEDEIQVINSSKEDIEEITIEDEWIENRELKKNQFFPSETKQNDQNEIHSEQIDILNKKVTIVQERSKGNMSTPSSYYSKATSSKVAPKICCAKCNSTFQSEESLNKHIETVHDSFVKKPTNCVSSPALMPTPAFTNSTSPKVEPKTYCEKLVQPPQTKKMKLQGQQESIYELSNQFYKCENCPKEFEDNRSLRHHIAKDHEGKKLYECCKCPSKFEFEYFLIKHLKGIHRIANPSKFVINLDKQDKKVNKEINFSKGEIEEIHRSIQDTKFVDEIEILD